MEMILEFDFWVALLAVLGWIWVMTSFGKFIGNLINKN